MNGGDENPNIISCTDEDQYQCRSWGAGCSHCCACQIQQPLDHENNNTDNTWLPKTAKQEHWNQHFIAVYDILIIKAVNVSHISI